MVLNILLNFMLLAHENHKKEEKKQEDNMVILHDQKVCLKNDNLSFCEKDSELVPIILDHFKKICEENDLENTTDSPIQKIMIDDKNNLVITTFGRKIGETEIKEIDLKSLDSYIENVKKKIESYSIDPKIKTHIITGNGKGGILALLFAHQLKQKFKDIKVYTLLFDTPAFLPLEKIREIEEVLGKTNVLNFQLTSSLNSQKERIEFLFSKIKLDDIKKSINEINKIKVSEKKISTLNRVSNKMINDIDNFLGSFENKKINFIIKELKSFSKYAKEKGIESTVERFLEKFEPYKTLSFMGEYLNARISGELDEESENGNEKNKDSECENINKNLVNVIDNVEAMKQFLNLNINEESNSREIEEALLAYFHNYNHEEHYEEKPNLHHVGIMINHSINISLDKMYDKEKIIQKEIISHFKQLNILIKQYFQININKAENSISHLKDIENTKSKEQKHLIKLIEKEIFETELYREHYYQKFLGDKNNEEIKKLVNDSIVKSFLNKKL